jgi:hypothetical protein
VCYNFACDCLYFIPHVTLPLTRFDIWFVTQLAKFPGRYPLVDLDVGSAIRHNTLGDRFAACVFIFWTEDARWRGQNLRQVAPADLSRLARVAANR